MRQSVLALRVTSIIPIFFPSIAYLRNNDLSILNASIILSSHSSSLYNSDIFEFYFNEKHSIE